MRLRPALGARGRAVGAVGYFAEVEVRFEKMGGGWLVSGLIRCDGVAFSLLVAMCPFGMPLVDRVYASELFI